MEKIRLTTFRIFITLVTAFAAAQLYAQTEETKEPATEEESSKGLKFTGIPLPSYSSDDGIGMGLRIYATNYKEGFEPYDFQLYGQVYRTTKGYEYHVLSLDSLRFFGTPLRVKMVGGIERTLNAQFYGIGNYHDISRQKEIAEGLTPAAENRSYYKDLYQINDHFTLNENYLNNPDLTKPDTYLNTERRKLRERQNKYYNYDRIKPFVQASSEDFIGKSNFKWFFGFRGQSYKIQSYKGDREGGEAEQNTATLIDIVKPVGYDAVESPKFVNTVRAAIAYDSRPRLREKNPAEGIFSDVHVESSGKGTGSDYSFNRVTVTHRQYFSILPSFMKSLGNREFIFGYRLLGQETFGNVPFYEMGYITNISNSEFNEGLGSNRGLRGYPANQFIDKVMVMGNTELRITLAKTSALGGIDFLLIGYYDIGRVAPSREEITTKGMHKAYGGGLRMVWQTNTIVNISYGRSETGGVNANFSFDHPF